MKTKSILPLRLTDLRFEAGGAARLDSVTLELAAGPKTLVMGPNGSGKSLLLRLCHGLLSPTSGHVRWASDDTRRLRRSQAMVFQRPILLRRSALANVEYGLAVRGVPRRERRQRALRAMEQAGLAHLVKRPAQVLSGGEQQRLTLARASALEPEVLFLDEPTANLDPAATASVEAMIDKIHLDGTKIVMTTHDLGQARRMADELILLHGGRVLARGTTDSLWSASAPARVAAFLRGELIHDDSSQARSLQESNDDHSHRLHP